MPNRLRENILPTILRRRNENRRVLFRARDRFHVCRMASVAYGSLVLLRGIINRRHAQISRSLLPGHAAKASLMYKNLLCIRQRLHFYDFLQIGS